MTEKELLKDIFDFFLIEPEGDMEKGKGFKAEGRRFVFDDEGNLEKIITNGQVYKAEDDTNGK